MSTQPLDISKLTPEEQLRLIEQLWSALSQSPDRLLLTQAQREELESRIAEADADGGDGIPWDEVLRRVRERRR